MKLSRRGFIRALFGTAAAVAVAKLPAMPEAVAAEAVPEVVRIPFTRMFARREIHEFGMQCDTGGVIDIFRTGPGLPEDLPLMRHGIGDGGCLFWRGYPGDFITLLKEHVLRFDFTPLPRGSAPRSIQPVRFHMVGTDYDDRGWERSFCETFEIGDNHSLPTELGRGLPLYVNESDGWRSPEEIQAARERARENESEYDSYEDDDDGREEWAA